MQDLIEHLTTLENTLQQVRTAMDPSAADAAIAEQVEALKATFDFEGINIAPTTVIAEAERKFRQKYDEDLRATVQSYSTDLAVVEQVLDTLEREAATIADPVAGASGETNRLLARTVQLLEQDRAERQLTGKTLRQIVTLYERSADGELRRVIEGALADSFAGLGLQQDAGDAEAILALQKAIGAQRSARVAERYPDLGVLRNRVRALRDANIMPALREHLRRGGGVAVRPRA